MDIEKNRFVCFVVTLIRSKRSESMFSLKADPQPFTTLCRHFMDVSRCLQPAVSWKIRFVKPLFCCVDESESDLSFTNAFSSLSRFVFIKLIIVSKRQNVKVKCKLFV